MNSIKISVITASFNQAKFISRTLNSVAAQSHPDIEHIILDPGSSDGSVDIIRAYAEYRHFVRFINEPDNGQVDAINKGLGQASGEVLTWLNTDDYYLAPDVLARVAEIFAANPDVMVVYGKGEYVDEDGSYIKDAYVNPADGDFRLNLSNSIGILQPALFFRRAVFERVGGLDPIYNLSLDYEYWLRFAFAGFKFRFANFKISGATLHSNSKTMGQRGKQYVEICQLMHQYYGYVEPVWLQRYADFLVNGADGIVSSTNTAAPALLSATRRLFQRHNPTAESVYSAFLRQPARAAEFLRSWLKQHDLRLDNAVLTTASAEYFDQLLTLIAGVHRTSTSCIDVIAVFDLSLSEEQRQQLFSIHGVLVLPYQGRNDAGSDWYFSPKAYVYKCAAMKAWLDLIDAGSRFIWMDTGVVPLVSLQILLDLADREGAFFVNHDDRTAIPFRNVNFTHKDALLKMQASAAEALGEHLCSCLIGARKGSRFDQLFEEAYLFSKDRQISLWPKHLAEEEKSAIISGKSSALRNRLESIAGDTASLSQVSIADVIDAFPYSGHRQDQSIYSVLAARYSAPILSATKYCSSTDESSFASKKNWESGGEWREIHRSETVPESVRISFTFHHRGTYSNREGLILRNSPEEKSLLALKRDMAAANNAIVGPFAREDSAHYDETDCIAALYNGALSGSVMIDVGAHFGMALQPFLDKGWQIFAFEPDEKNRGNLLDRLSKHKNRGLVTLDTRCVSNESKQGLSFYRSEQSTGISGLSAFHESHVEAQRVDTTTLTDFFQDRPMPAIDFLKIDTEGHDLFVLKGFPWERARPAVIECEFEDTKTVPLGYTFHDLARFLVDKGYTVYVSEWHPIVRYGIRHDWRRLSPYPCQLADKKAWGNLLAFREPIDEAILAGAVKGVLKLSGKTFKPAQATTPSEQTTLTLGPINALFRRADYTAALKGYVALYRQRPLPMYLDNARMAASRLGHTADNASYKELERLVA